MLWYLRAVTNIAPLGFVFSICKRGNNVHSIPVAWFASAIVFVQALIQNECKYIYWNKEINCLVVFFFNINYNQLHRINYFSKEDTQTGMCTECENCLQSTICST